MKTIIFVILEIIILMVFPPLGIIGIIALLAYIAIRYFNDIHKIATNSKREDEHK